MKMMKTTLFAIAAMAAVSCVKENIQDNTSSEVNANLVELTITAGTENGETKAAFSEDAYPQIVWQGNEEISVLGATTGNQKFTTTSTGSKAAFSGLADLTDDVLYAVYPYDAAVTLTNDGKLSNVTVPAVQTATSGSFDPKAYIAVAKSTDKENFSFKSVGGFVKFNLEDATNVKSVTMVSNAGANMACTGTANLKNDGSVAHESPYVNASSSVKLEGTFETGKEYFMVVRPQPYTGGITLYIEYTDGTVLSRTSEKALFESGKGRNYIRNLGTLRKADFTKITGLYSLYSLGYDIAVGDMTINKTTHTASILNVTEANKDLSVEFKKGGVYFINQNDECSFTIGGYVDVAGDLIIIGNNPSGKVSYNHSSTHYYNLANGTFAMKGVSVNLGSKYMINNSKCTNNTGKIIFDDCSISNAQGSLYYGSKADIGISLFQFNKCDIVTTSNIQLLNLNKTTVMNDYTNIKFTDCTFSSASMAGFILVNSATATQTGTAPTSALEVKNCTFHNLRPNPSFINVPWCGNLKFNKNLVSIYSLTGDGTMVSANTDSGNLSVIDASDNYYYVKNFSEKTLKAKSSDSQSVTSEMAYMFNTETFVVKTEYAGYGATR